MSLEGFEKPTKIDDLRAAFPSDVSDLLPPYDEVPEEFRRSSNPWCRLVSKWFFEGLTREDIPALKVGIDWNEAIRHLKACMSSWEPKHEHKEAGVAYLMSRWFQEEEG